MNGAFRSRAGPASLKQPPVAVEHGAARGGIPVPRGAGLIEARRRGRSCHAPASAFRSRAGPASLKRGELLGLPALPDRRIPVPRGAGLIEASRPSRSTSTSGPRIPVPRGAGLIEAGSGSRRASAARGCIPVPRGAGLIEAPRPRRGRARPAPAFRSRAGPASLKHHLVVGRVEAERQHSGPARGRPH